MSDGHKSGNKELLTNPVHARDVIFAQWGKVKLVILPVCGVNVLVFALKLCRVRKRAFGPLSTNSGGSEPCACDCRWTIRILLSLDLLNHKADTAGGLY